MDDGPERQRSSWSPRQWGISTRSAATSAAVVSVTFVLASIGLVSVLHHSLIAGVDNDAATRVSDIAAALSSQDLERLNPGLLTTDQRLTAVQILGPDGTVALRSESASAQPLIADGEVTDTTEVHGLPTPVGDAVRVSARQVQTENGSYAALVGSSDAAVHATVRRVAFLLIAATVLVSAVAAAATYLFVKRSLRSVEAMRARVADISASDLDERVPVPPSHDEIHALATTMNGMLARIESSQMAQRRFVGDASQELRAPLNSLLSALNDIEGNPSLLGRTVTPSTLLPQAHQMKTLVEDLLLLARADEHGLAQRREEIAIADLVQSEVARQRRQTDLTITATADDGHVVADADSLARVLRNLLDNAVQHARAQVEVHSRIIAGQLILTVIDDGPGIPAQDRDRVFGRFIRLNCDSAPHRTGLGLAIVAELVAAHHGTVEIDESARGGAEVTVRMPSGQ